MRAGTLSAALAVILAGHLYAAERPTDLLLEYTERLLALEDTAQAHVELAKWCETNGLPDRATIHWQEALSHDPDNEEARRALDIGRQETRETQEAGPVLEAAPALLEKQRALATEIRDILRRFLLPTDAEAWAEGRRRILRLSDPAGVTPLTRILGEGTVAERRLAAEALGGILGDEAREALVRMLLTDRSKDVYLAALRSLKSRADSARVGPLVQALGGSKGARRRAAYALGELNAWHAIGALIGHLKAPEPRVVKAPPETSGRGAYIAIGTITTYVRDAELVVSNGAVAWNPVIGAIMSGAVLSVSNVHVTARRTVIRVLAPQPVVLAALKKITGEDFGYDAEAWRAWRRRVKTERWKFNPKPLRPGQTYAATLDLGLAFDLTLPGTYRASVGAELYPPGAPKIGKEFTSEVTALDFKVTERLPVARGKTDGAIPEKEAQELPAALRAALRSAGADNVDARRRAAADLCIALLKKSGAWRVDPLNWKIPTEEGIRLEVAHVAKSDQTEELAIANMCAHCMGMLKSGTWLKQPLDEQNPLEEAVASLAKKSTDPVVRTMLLLGLASSPRAHARDTVVAATSDPHAGVRKSVCYLVERCTSRSFGPLGCIHIGSPQKDVEVAGRNIRTIYRWDRTLGAGWGEMRGGLQTRLVVEDKVAVIGQPIKVSLMVRNVSDHRVSLPSKVHPVRHFKVLCNKKYVPLMGRIPDPLPSVTLDPGKQVEYWTFVVNDHFKVLKPGTYEIWLARTGGGLLPPRSNRVDLRLEPRRNAPEPTSDR